MMSARRPIRRVSAADPISSSATVTSNSKYLRPVPSRSSISQVFVNMLIQICRRIIFFHTPLRILAYISALFFLSLIFDTLPIPKFYLASKRNVLNVYFVKWGWLWTLILTLPFIFLTSRVYCCGKKDLIMKHMLRMFVGTVIWFFTINSFNYIEDYSGICAEKRDIVSKDACGISGFRWKGFDTSGHSFLLIYSTLVLIEESRPIIGWESLKDHLKNEAFARTSKTQMFTPLQKLSDNEFVKFEAYYKKSLPFVRFLFVVITVFTIIWDIMLLNTIIYFHTMPEKLFGGSVAIVMWLLTYHVWYRLPMLMLCRPGDGLFKYGPAVTESIPLAKDTNSSGRRNSVPKFMGMPLKNMNNQTSQNQDG